MAMGGGNQYLQQQSLQSGDQTQAFIDCILLYAKNLEADAVSVELQVWHSFKYNPIGPVLQASRAEEPAAGQRYHKPD